MLKISKLHNLSNLSKFLTFNSLNSLHLNFEHFLPFCCWNCDKRLEGNLIFGLCNSCYTAIERLPYCSGCGNFTPSFTSTCGKCINQPQLWQNVVIAGKFAPPLSNLIHQFKFQHKFYLDKTLASLMKQGILEAQDQYNFSFPEVIIPTPLHHLRHWKRGFNQSEYLASFLGKFLQIPVDKNFIVRIKNTPPQRGLNQDLRHKNLKQAFSFKPHKKFKYRSIAIVDDVITTGSTVREIAKVARRARVEEIQVWGLAKT